MHDVPDEPTDTAPESDDRYAERQEVSAVNLTEIHESPLPRKPQYLSMTASDRDTLIIGASLTAILLVAAWKFL